MKPRYWFAALGIPAILLTVIALMPHQAQSEEDSEARVAAVADIMASVNGPSMKNLASIFQTAPETDEDWAGLGRSARMLNEVGHVLMQNGRCPDAVWAKASSDLRAFAASYAQAAEAKDLDAAKAACAKVGASCKSCHDKHREE